MTTALSRPLVLVASLVFASESPAAEAIYLEPASTPALLEHEGRKVVVHGETEGSGKSASGTNYVNFKGAEFYLITFKTDLEPFAEGEPHEVYDGKRLAVEGTLTIYQGKPQIKLTEPSQIRVLEPDAVFPPPAKEVQLTSSPVPESKREAEATTEQLSEEEPKRKPPVDPREYFKE